jgi:CarD-like protein
VASRRCQHCSIYERVLLRAPQGSEQGRSVAESDDGSAQQSEQPEVAAPSLLVAVRPRRKLELRDLASLKLIERQGAGMNDRESEEVRRSVEDFLRGQAEQGLDVGKKDHFERLLSYVRCFLTGQPADDDLRMVTAMCWLGPRAGIPPEPQREELLQIMRTSEPEPDLRSRRAMEFVIAYGCGKWRKVEPGAGEWRERWPGAIQGLQRALEPAVKECDRWLRVRARVVGYPQRAQDDLAGDAWMLALRLVHAEKPLHLICDALSLRCTDDGAQLEASGYSDSVPNGAKAVFAVKGRQADLHMPDTDVPALDVGSRVVVAARDDDTRIQVISNDSSKRSRLRLWEGASITGPTLLAFWTCSCGHLHCAQRHRLEAWDPGQVSLWSFVASAIKGPQPSIQLGSFIAGMYFPLLAKEGFGLRLRIADVEYKVCQPCSRSSPMPANGGRSPNQDLAQPTIGDYVVHNHYGTGVLVGEMSISVSDIEKEYLCIQYAEGGKLYVPPERIADITRYVGADQPREGTLGSAGTFEYEGNSCPKQGHAFDPRRSHRVTHERLILVGDYAPHYLQRPRIRCKNRSAHYSAITGRAAAGDLTERWENLFQPSSSSTFSDIMDAKRALTDQQYLELKLDDPPSYAPILAPGQKVDERAFRRSLKAWLAASLDASCPLCGEKPSKTRLSTVWERTFAVVEPIESNESKKEETEAEDVGQLEGSLELIALGTETEESIHDGQEFDC